MHTAYPSALMAQKWRPDGEAKLLPGNLALISIYRFPSAVVVAGVGAGVAPVAGDVGRLGESLAPDEDGIAGGGSGLMAWPAAVHPVSRASAASRRRATSGFLPIVFLLGFEGINPLDYPGGSNRPLP
jgi:hypothetical protein